MQFHSTPIADVFIVDVEPIEDSRGFFARAWCSREFQEQGLKNTIAQCNLSYNYKQGSIRGMHYQLPPHEEVKMVRCISGAIFDVVIDLRKDSPTYKKWFGAELSAANYKMLYVPEGFAHGYQTLEKDSVVFYQVTEYYQPGAERGVRWDDPVFNIAWPLPLSEISDKDKSYPDFKV